MLQRSNMPAGWCFQRWPPYSQPVTANSVAQGSRNRSLAAVALAVLTSRVTRHQAPFRRRNKPYYPVYGYMSSFPPSTMSPVLQWRAP
jgi:hypothetical protein